MARSVLVIWVIEPPHAEARAVTEGCLPHARGTSEGTTLYSSRCTLLALKAMVSLLRLNLPPGSNITVSIMRLRVRKLNNVNID